MSAVAVSDLPANHPPVRFAVTGIGATLLYGLLATAFSTPTSPILGSVLAYALAAIFSYAGHKYFTFASNGAHRFEVPRFAALTLAGLATAFALPTMLSEGLGLPVQVPIALTCVLVSLVNYAVLRHWVFGSALAGPGSGCE